MQLTICRLGPGDSEAVERLLSQDPILNVYLLSEFQQGSTPQSWWGLTAGGELRSLLLAGPLVVPYIPDAVDAEPLATVLASQTPAVRMLVGPRRSVLALHAAAGWQARDLRDPQPVLTVTDESLRAHGGETGLRLATRDDLDQLTTSAAAMHQEEMGIDPMSVDADAWRSRMTQLIDRHWSWVWMDKGAVVFKAELSAWTPQAAQIQGVYTSWPWRGRGVATTALGQLCAELLQNTQSCTLYVNHYNEAARRLYTKLGFIQTSEFATIVY